MDNEIIDSELNEEDVLTDSSEGEEEMLPKSRVQELVRKAKMKGREKMTDELEQLKRENEALKSQGMGGMQAQQKPEQFDYASVKDQIKNEMMADFDRQREAQEQQHLKQAIEQFAQDYNRKMEQGKKDYADFDEVVGEFDPESSPGLTILIGQLPNAHDVVYEIAKNPNKHAMLDIWAERNPEKARRELQKLSQSIEVNKAAQAAEKPVNDPLSRMQPSPLAGQDSGQPDIRDYKRMFRG